MPWGSAYFVFFYVLYQPLDKDSAQAEYNILQSCGDERGSVEVI